MPTLSISQVSRAELVSSAALRLERDWAGNLVDSPISTWLDLSGNTLSLVAKRQSKAECNMDNVEKSYTEGLWEQDVVELFLAKNGGSEYFEFNLAPSGAWWCMAFSDRRIRIPDFDQHLPEVVTENEVGKDHWRVSIDIDIRSLDIRSSELDHFRGNISAHISKPDAFLSYAKLPGETPDFHQPEHFLRMQLV